MRGECSMMLGGLAAGMVVPLRFQRPIEFQVAGGVKFVDSVSGEDSGLIRRCGGTCRSGG
jgi:hypothetical protein